MGKWQLSLTMRGGFGESYTTAIDLEPDIAHSLQKIIPPERFDTFDGAVETMQRKEFRRETFIAETRRLAEMLANHMEDSEGWHGVDRIERATRTLRRNRR